MIALLLTSVAALAALIVLAMFAYGAWVAHNLTLQERMPVFGHPMQLGLHWEDVAFPSRGMRSRWWARICRRLGTAAALSLSRGPISIATTRQSGPWNWAVIWWIDTSAYCYLT